ncbi:MAG: ribulose-phosphate 3-epimerase [Liquorilactobacillus nagelii]|jgi:ribulose-phosphate 3-epimerase|uniref:ribulose-phosphate 3-epimerase n=1 Tax=Liquorilactobacillus nagelii TaxID=82688 RepID=UPI002431B215|nr:ribulose-phosphate 3-epimerase [Liquorilactobacillus nagelii]MCI1634442.1 ribulose-phosphate 3-epimerase [Liquorilactobacillus nagelii]
MKIAPSILSADFANLGRDVQLLEQAGADYLHIDIMDGHFVPNLSFGLPIVKALRPITKLPFDCHLMVTDPAAYIQPLAAAGATMIGVHAEATPHIFRIIQQIKQAGCRAEVVVNPGTSLSTIEEVLPLVDSILVMTVNPGFGGQKFLPLMLKKIQRLAELKQRHHYNFEIEVDGGINQATIKRCYRAGATIAVAGSFVFAAEPAKQVNLLREAAEAEQL